MPLFDDINAIKFQKCFGYYQSPCTLDDLKTVTYAYQEMPHSEDTASPHRQDKERKGESMVYKMTISKQTPQTINKNENLRGYRLGTVSGKTICHWGFKPGSRMHQPHTCPYRFSYQQTSTSCFGEITPTH
jgi:hypothetical protein